MRRLVKGVFFLAVFLGLAALACGGVLMVVSKGNPVNFVQKELIRAQMASHEDELDTPVGADTTPIRFTVAPGDSPRTIASNLLAANLIKDADLFVNYVRLNDIDVKLEAGTYFLTHSQTIPQIAQTLTDSRSSQFPFRIIEGWRMEEIAASIDRSQDYFPFTGQDFLRAVGSGIQPNPTFAATVGLPAGESLEGFLFPNTYELPAAVTPAILRDTLTQGFLDQVGAQIPADAAQQGFTMYQIVTLASIVQREAVHADEAPMVASVYRNRLRDGMRLESDPTVQYPIGFKNGTWWPPITIDDFTTVISPYNTYLNDGLPPGPIANPGLVAIRAAVYPATSDYYYFYARCDGSGYHMFARTYEEHLNNVNSCSGP